MQISTISTRLKNVVLVIAVFLPLLFSHSASAAKERTIEVVAGSVIELTVDTEDDAEFSWVLTKDRKFINAQRTRFFQTRQTVPGTYVLDVNIRNGRANTTQYEEFIIIIHPSDDAVIPQRSSAESIEAILHSVPTPKKNAISIERDGTILRLDPSESKGPIARFALDLDSAVDVNGDGNATNDTDNEGTINLIHGSPLYVLVFPKEEERIITLHAIGQDPSESDEASLLLTSKHGTSEELINDDLVTENPEGPIVLKKRGRAIEFSLNFDTETLPSNLLYEWDFGDNARSLLTRPKHTYIADGNYSIQLSLRDLTSGEIYKSFSVDTEVRGGAEVVSSSSSSSSSSVSRTPDKEPETSSSVNWSLILKILGGSIVLLIIVISIIGLVRFIRSKTGTKLEDALKTMEEHLIQDSDKKPSDTPDVIPMRLKRPEQSTTEEASTTPNESAEPTSEEQAQTEEKKADFTPANERTNETPVASAGPVPSWLGGESTDTTTNTSSANPTPEPAVPSWLSETATPEPSASQTVNTQSELAKESPVTSDTSAPLPSWMQEPVTQEQPIASQENVPLPTEITPSTDTPAPTQTTDEALPPWLAATPNGENGTTEKQKAEVEAEPEEVTQNGLITEPEVDNQPEAEQSQEASMPTVDGNADTSPVSADLANTPQQVATNDEKTPESTISTESSLSVPTTESVSNEMPTTTSSSELQSSGEIPLQETPSTPVVSDDQPIAIIQADNISKQNT